MGLKPSRQLIWVAGSALALAWTASSEDAAARLPASGQEAPQGSIDTVFADGFELTRLSIEHDVAIDGLSGDRFGWLDAAGLPRWATLAHNDGGTAGNDSRGGELREFRYQVDGATRIVRATDGAAGGFGYAVADPIVGSFCRDGHEAVLGHTLPGQYQRVFEGRHHSIFRFTQSYPLSCASLPFPPIRYAAVTIDWMFANGRDHPLWSVSWDLSSIPVDVLAYQSSAPYGELRIEGAASDDARGLLAGIGWGDRYRFTTTTEPLTLGSAWTWNQPNTIPYVTVWTDRGDATMGIVQSETIDQQDAGGAFSGQDLWMTSSVITNGCVTAYVMPCAQVWPFGAVQSLLSGGDPIADARLAWGTYHGFLGWSQYPIRGNARRGGASNGTALPGDPVASGWPNKSYSTHIVLGTRSSDPVGKQVAEIETIQTLSLTATVGSVAADGPAGIADASVQPYAPAGYDAVYGALTFVAADDRLDAQIAVGAGVLRHPLIVVRDYDQALPATLRLNGVALVRDRDWLPSVRSDTQELWITLLRDLSAVNRIEIEP